MSFLFFLPFFFLLPYNFFSFFFFFGVLIPFFFLVFLFLRERGRESPRSIELEIQCFFLNSFYCFLFSFLPLGIGVRSGAGAKRYSERLETDVDGECV